MHIKRVRLKNGYKRFKDLTIDLGPDPARIIALVGPNGCGKSSVLDGLMYHANAHSTIGENGNRNPSYHSMTGINPSYNSVEIEFTEGSFSKVHERLAATGSSNTILSFRSPYRYNSSLLVHETRSVSDIKLNGYGAADASSLDARIESNYRRIHAHFNRYRDDNDVKPSEARSHIIGELNASIRNCLDIEIASLGNVEASKGTLFFRKLDHPMDFSFDVLSSGEKEVVDILLDLYLRRSDYNNTVFLIDEPELHINTAIQGKLLIEIDKLIGENCQIWLTTHSIGFLRTLQNELRGKSQIIQFQPSDNLAAEPKTLKPLEVGPGTWRELFAVALGDLADLVSPSVIIYCEGRAEPGPGGKERGLDAKVFNTVFSQRHPEAFFTSSGGNTEPDQRSAIAISILGKVFPKVEIWVLKDRDMASGRETNETDRQAYLNTNPLSHRVLKRWEIENYLFDKEVLKSYCSNQGLVFDEAAYDKLVTDIINQDVKSETNAIRNICGIKSSINPDIFKERLAKHIHPGGLVYQELEECIFRRS
ncbi:AAA family ATPase [Rhodobacter sp. NSM]|uniref:AAA family ATPase n=1 Tax=Rhodobacter sp. NSM TaxID=3457501 RepID=UPI003FD55494